MSEAPNSPAEVTEIPDAPETMEVDQDGPDSPEYLAFKEKTFGKEAFKKATEDLDEEREYQEFKEKKAKQKKDEEDEKNASEEKPKPEPKKEKTPEKRIKKIKVNDKEVEFDLSNEEETLKQVALGLSSTERFSKASAIEKNSRKFVEALKNNPFEVLKHPSFGLDLRKVCEEYLYENHVKKEMMPEEERVRHEEQAELKRYREAEKQRETERKLKAQEEMKEKYRQDYVPLFKEVLETSGLPASDWTIGRMATYMKLAISKGYKDIKPSDVVAHVKEDWQKHLRTTFSNATGDQLIEMFGKEVVDKVRKANLAQYSSESNGAPVVRTQPREAKPPKQYNSKEEMMRDIMRR